MKEKKPMDIYTVLEDSVAVLSVLCFVYHLLWCPWFYPLLQGKLTTQFWASQFSLCEGTLNLCDFWYVVSLKRTGEWENERREQWNMTGYSIWESLCVLFSQEKALYANLFTCAFLQVPSLYSVHQSWPVLSLLWLQY